MLNHEAYRNCRLCPRRCGVDRTAGERGLCGETSELRVSWVGPHFGEEPPITGTHGSGTVFLTGCSLRCAFCQNRQSSRGGLGRPVALAGLGQEVMALIRERKVHNVNFVTPDHFLPHVFGLIHLLREAGDPVPTVFNLSGYQSIPVLLAAEPFADIYLPDFKYADRSLAARLSRCGNYPRIALAAIAEMVRQKGFLPQTEGAIARGGVLVRHLILPGQIANTLDALTALFVEFGPHLPLSLMSQYHPARPQRIAELNRPITPGEFDRAYTHALELGFEHLFVQFPEPNRDGGNHHKPLVPDFRMPQPFGNGPATSM